MANNPTSPDKLRELAPRLLSRKDIIVRAKYGAALGARTNPAVEQWFINREGELAKRKASELVMTAVQQPDVAEVQRQEDISTLQALREGVIMDTEHDMLVADKRNLVKEAYLPLQSTVIDASDKFQRSNETSQPQYGQENDDAIAA